MDPFEQSIAAATNAATCGDWARALTLWEAVAEQYSDRPEGFMGKGTALIELRRFQEADVVLSQAMQRFPLHLWLAVAHAQNSAVEISARHCAVGRSSAINFLISPWAMSASPRHCGNWANLSPRNAVSRKRRDYFQTIPGPPTTMRASRLLLAIGRRRCVVGKPCKKAFQIMRARTAAR